MKFNPEIHHRQTLRLREYDYSEAGAYFVTVCTRDRECLFGEIVEGEMKLNDSGKMIQAVWNELLHRFPVIQLDAFIVMPNHVHGVIVIVGAGLVSAHPAGICASENGVDTRPTPTLGDVVCAFKSITTLEYSRGVKTQKWPPFPGKLWHRNYFEHVIQNDDALNRIRQYIQENPQKWEFDEENPIFAVGVGFMSTQENVGVGLVSTRKGNAGLYVRQK